MLFSSAYINDTGVFNQVMHGADRDILWLQRDFGIYVCNLFDTGQVCSMQLVEFPFKIWFWFNYSDISTLNSRLLNS